MDDKTTSCPFVIAVDTAEQHPYTFDNIRADADRKNRIFEAETQWISLGRHPNGYGDYSIVGYEGNHSGEGVMPAVGIERKSVEDFQGTVLGWPDSDGKGGRRERFEQELRNLAELHTAAVVIEGSMGECIRTVPAHGEKDQKTNGKILWRSILAHQTDYLVPFVFCHSRREAEISTFRILYRFFKHQNQKFRKAKKKLLEEAGNAGS